MTGKSLFELIAPKDKPLFIELVRGMVPTTR